MYYTTGNDFILLIFNHHNLNFNLVMGRYSQNNKLEMIGSVYKSSIDLSYSSVWTTSASSRSSSAPVDTCFLDECDSILRAPMVT